MLKWRTTPGVACCCHKNMTFRIWSVYFGSKLLYQYLWVPFRIRFLQYSHTRGSGQFSWSGRVKVWVSGEQVAPIFLVAVVLLPLLSLLESSLVLLLVLLSPLLFFEELKLLLTPPFFVLLFILPSPQVIVTLKKGPALYQAKALTALTNLHILHILTCVYRLWSDLGPIKMKVHNVCLIWYFWAGKASQWKERIVCPKSLRVVTLRILSSKRFLPYLSRK